MVLAELQKMESQDQMAFLMEYERQRKQVGLAYLFFLLLGCHYAYLGKWGLQVAFWLTGGGVFIWALIDLFRMQSLVNDYNKGVSEALFYQMRAMLGKK